MAQASTTTTTTTTTSTQNVQALTVTPQSSVQSVGNFVTDVSLQPYIATTIISFYATNMRPNQLIHVFFDSINVDQYCAPGTLSGTDTSDYNSVTRTGNWGTAIYADASGHVAGQFNIPASTFKVGDRVLTLSDVSNLSLGGDAATTIASATFTASNLSVTKQNTTLTTVNPQISTANTVVTAISTNTVITAVPIPPLANDPQPAPDDYQYAPPQQTSWPDSGGSGAEPIAQALTISTPNQEAGVFVTAIDLFFQQKSLVGQHGVLLFLCETVNGYPNGSAILPFSQVHLTDAQINVSADASVATTFTFEGPVFLQNGKEYAFVVQPDANDPDFFLYTAELGDTDISSGIQVFSQPAVGTAFYGATTTEWTALQTEYIKFNLYRASFSASSGDVYFVDTPFDYLKISGISYVNTSVGVLPGDYIYSAVNTTPSTANTSVYGVLQYYNTQTQNFHTSNTTGNFGGTTFVQIHRFANSTHTPNTSTLIASANLIGIYNPVVDAVVPQFATITPAGTGITYTIAGTSNTYSTDATETSVIIGTETELRDKERIVASRTNEVTSMSGNTSIVFHAKMTSDSTFLSPVIDTVKNKQLVIKNEVDKVSLNFDEFYTYGSSKSKYISRVITLAQGQDSQDLQVILSAYRPPNTDIQVWVKFLNGEDSESLTNKVWTPLASTSAAQYCDPSNPKNFQEFVFQPTILYPMFGKNGTVTANTSSPVIIGNTTTFTSDYKVGWWVNMAANSTWNETSRQIVSITNNTYMTLSNPFTNNYSNSSMYLVVPPTTAYLSTNTATQLTGTVTANSGTNIVTGSGTNFTGQLIVGSIIDFSGDSQAVVSITNATSLTVGTPWSSNVAGVNAYSVTPAGVTYLNSSGVLYTTFNKFQIKIILQSDDSSKVPLIDDLRVLALQL